MKHRNAELAQMFQSSQNNIWNEIHNYANPK